MQLRRRSREIVVVVSATESHSRSNVNRSRESAIELLRYARAGRDAIGSGPVILCGRVRCLWLPVRRRRQAGIGDACGRSLPRRRAEVISLADTVGVAGPRQITELLGLVTPRVGNAPVVIHLHDTRGTGVANAYAALDAGIRVLDGTIGGLGGFRSRRARPGTFVFEDLVYLCERSGFSTGIDLDRLIGIRSILEREMPGENLFGAMARAGTPKSISWKSLNLPGGPDVHRAHGDVACNAGRVGFQVRSEASSARSCSLRASIGMCLPRFR